MSIVEQLIDELAKIKIRLEAAEAVCERAESFYSIEFDALIAAWRKVKEEEI